MEFYHDHRFAGPLLAGKRRNRPAADVKPLLGQRERSNLVRGAGIDRYLFGSTVSGQTGLTGLYGVVTGLSGGVTYYWEANATGAAATGAWSGVWSFSAGMTQVIPLNTAWNMKSLNVIPLQDTTTAVFGTDPGGFLFVKDNAGDVYCPAAYQDNINYVQVGQGYQVYTTVADTMEVLGIPVNYATTAISLSSGWNMIAYLPPTDDSIEHALAGIDTLIIIVKNNSGHAYWPSLGIDDIGIMYVGEGYKVLMSSGSVADLPDAGYGGSEAGSREGWEDHASPARSAALCNACDNREQCDASGEAGDHRGQGGSGLQRGRGV